MANYKHPALKQLADQQVRFVPPPRRLEQMKNAERLLVEVQPEKQYPYQFICYRITDYRPDAFPDMLISGQDVRHDLGLLIAELANSLPAVPIEEVAEPIFTLEQMSKKLHVTTKTLNRWRKRGLIALPVLCNGRRQVGFVESMVAPFLDTNKERVAQSGRFSQMSDYEKDEIVRRARRLARVAQGALTEVSKRIARKLGRSTEAVRYTIKNFDRDHPEQAVFPEAAGPLSAEAKQLIFNSYRRGIAVDTLARQFQRTRASIYRVVNEVRAQRLLEKPLDYISHESFDDPACQQDILADMPDVDRFEAARQAIRVPKDAPPELASLYEMPLLTREQEAHLFRKMNYLKHQASKLRTMLEPSRARGEDLAAIEQVQEQAQKIKEMLVNCNMRLVVSIAKRHAGQGDNFFDLLSDGNMSLLRAVEKFDYSRGNKFSTYASWAIMKNFARSIPEEKHRRERYVTGHEEVFNDAPDNRSDEHEVVASAEQATHKVNRLLEYLDPRERQIVRMRAGLESGTEAMTLEKIGEQLGITKERVRQLNVRAMKKLRTLAEDQKLEML
jgi:RNA polymerase sigma factor (sigma-70 family)